MSTIKLVIAVPTAGRTCFQLTAAIGGLVSYIAANGVRTRPEATIELSMDYVASSNWITNREKLAARAVEFGQTHMLFIDDDMSFEPQILDIMLGRRQDIVVTNYLIKSEPKEESEFVAVGLDGKRLKTGPKSTGLEPINFSGFGVSLFSTDVFRKTPQPWFQPEFVPERNEYTTEDNPFFRRARESGFTVYLDHDASKIVAHHGVATWKWGDLWPTQQ